MNNHPTSAGAKHLPHQQRSGVALCLSGGGYRAALFHLGALRRLDEVGVLSRVTTVSSVSGGSIVAAHLVEHVKKAGAEALVDVDPVIEQIRTLTSRNIRTWPILKRALPWNWARGDTQVEALARTYAHLITKRAVAELPERPAFVVCATDMSYGANWIFTRERMGDYQVGYKSPSDFSLARAVAASSCFPPVFGPLRPRLGPAVLTGGRAAGRVRDDAVRRMGLTDGGVYDNMALEPVWKDHEVVLVSDGGATFDFGADKGLLWRLQRYNEIISRQASGMRKRWLISGLIRGEMRGTYWGIGSATTSYGMPGGYPEDLVREVIAQVRTDLDAFSDGEKAVLENHGYLVMDAAVRRHLSDMVNKPSEPRVPHREWMDEQRVRNALRDSHKTKLPFGRR